jgi:hypothetical protein
MSSASEIIFVETGLLRYPASQSKGNTGPAINHASRYTYHDIAPWYAVNSVSSSATRTTEASKSFNRSTTEEKTPKRSTTEPSKPLHSLEELLAGPFDPQSIPVAERPSSISEIPLTAGAFLRWVTSEDQVRGCFQKSVFTDKIIL